MLLSSKETPSGQLEAAKKDVAELQKLLGQKILNDLYERAVVNLDENKRLENKNVPPTIEAVKAIRTDNKLFVTGRRTGPLIGAKSDANAIKEKQDTNGIFDDEISVEDIEVRDVNNEFFDGTNSYSELNQRVSNIKSPLNSKIDEFNSVIQVEYHAQQITAVADVFRGSPRNHHQAKNDHVKGEMKSRLE